MRIIRNFSAAITDRPRLATVMIVLMLTACGPSDADDNGKIMENAASSLTYSIGDRPYMLEKVSGAAALPGVRSKVAVFFGYGDNRAICKEVAVYLMEQPGAMGAQYDCNVID